MSTRHYVEINASELESFLLARGFEEQPTFHGERIFAKQYGKDEEIIVYSSLPSHADAVRPVGMDAIRLVVRWSKDKWFHKAGKVLRIATWQKNFVAKMEAAEQKFGLSVQKADKDLFIKNNPEGIKAASAWACVVCGEEPNGTLADGSPICSWHQNITLRVGIDVGDGKDYTAGVKMDRFGNVIAVSQMAEA